MKTMARSNSEIMRDQMRGEFVKYDQRKMMEKFHLTYNESDLYIDFVGRPNRVGRRSGVVEWPEDGFATAHEADYNASMTIYDVLCDSKEDCRLSGKYCPVHMLRGTIKSSTGGGYFFQLISGFVCQRIAAVSPVQGVGVSCVHLVAPVSGQLKIQRSAGGHGQQ